MDFPWKTLGTVVFISWEVWILHSLKYRVYTWNWKKLITFFLAIAIHQKHFLVAQTMSCLVFSPRGGQRSMMLTSLCMFAFQVHLFLIFLKYTDMRILRQDPQKWEKSKVFQSFQEKKIWEHNWHPCSPLPSAPKTLPHKPQRAYLQFLQSLQGWSK